MLIGCHQLVVDLLDLLQVMLEVIKQTVTYSKTLYIMKKLTPYEICLS